MPEKEPVYFKEFREHVDKKFDGIDKKFEAIDNKFERIDGKFEGIDKRFEGIDKNFESLKTNIYELTLSTAKGFREIDFRFDGVENEMGMIRESIGKIEGHIGRNNVRATYIEELVLKDLEPRIDSLERDALAA